jgi:hypothetical protein
LKKVFEKTGRFRYDNFERLKFRQALKRKRCEHIIPTLQSAVKDEKRAK